MAFTGDPIYSWLQAGISAGSVASASGFLFQFPWVGFYVFICNYFKFLSNS